MPAVNPGRSSLEAWWALEESSGTRSDSHGANHLSPSGSPASGTGVVGSALDLESTTSDYLSRASTASLQFGDESFSVAAWVKLESKQAFHTLIGKYDASASPKSEWELNYRSTTDRFRFIVSANDAGSVQGVVSSNVFGAPSLATWYFVVGVHDAAGNTVQISVNAGTADSAAYSGGCHASTADITIGLRNNTGVLNYGDGLHDEVCVYRKALSADEITWLYNGGAGRSYAATAGAGLPVLAHWHEQTFGGGW